jgi:hypothetical protein
MPTRCQGHEPAVTDYRQLLAGAVRTAEPRPLGDLLATRSDYSYPHAETREHVDQGVGAEQVDSTAQEVAYSWLRYTKSGGRCGLRQVAALDLLLQAQHQARPHQEMLRFVSRKAQVSENVAAGAATLTSVLLHAPSPFCSPEALGTGSAPSRDPALVSFGFASRTRAARTPLRRTVRRREPCAQAPCGHGSPRPLARRSASASSPRAALVAAGETVDSRRFPVPRQETLGGPQARSPARRQAFPRPGHDISYAILCQERLIPSVDS